MESSTLSTGSALQSGKYRILKVLGQGGFGITYLAEQTGLGRQVAVKEFFMKEYCNREEATSHVSVGSEGSRELVERFRAKFVKEARLIASLNHANIIRIHDVFEENGTAYYVMDYLPGGSVSDLLSKTGDLSLNTALKYTRQIGEALDYIHTRPDPLNHLDVKPSNIMLDDNGDAVLVDFGLSKRYDAGGHQTSSTPVGVSHGYAPMEQYKDGGVKEFSPTTDIYSLGATLYKMLTDETPPQASDVNEDGLPDMGPGIPEYIKSAIEKAMQPRKKDRPQGVKEFLGMLEPDSDRPASPGTSAGESEETVITAPADSSFKAQPVRDPKPAAAHKPTSAQPKVQPTTSKTSKPSAASKPAAPSSGKKRGWLKWFLIGLAAVVVLSLLARGCGSDNQAPEPIPVEEIADSLANTSDNFTNLQSQSGQAQSASAAERPASEQPATQPVEPKTGSLKLTSTPSGADIWIDGKNTGKKTPDIIEDLTAGSHKVVLKSSGYEDLSQSITISAGRRADKDLQLKKKELSQTEPAYTPAEMNKIGDDYYYGRNGKQKDYSQAVVWYRKSAEQGHSVAQNNLGVCYGKGQGVAQDYSQAVVWYRKSAEQGYAWAQNNLGVCYGKGQGVAQDYSQAVSWYRKSAEQGNASAQNNLGYCYDKGQGVSQDYTQAVSWYRKSAEQGNANAQCNLGYCYANGNGVPQDYSQAVSWYRKSAEQGNDQAQHNLGHCYDKGNGVPQDYSQAVSWYRKSAEQGHSVAQNNLGVCYELGKGVAQDYSQAVSWYRKSAEQGYSVAQYNLGSCYEYGKGTEKDMVKATDLYKKAARQGNRSAISSCERLGLVY